MKRVVASSLAAVAASVSLSALAQESSSAPQGTPATPETKPAEEAAAAPAAAKTPAAETPAKTITPYGLLFANLHLLDSANRNPLNGESAYARLGVKVKEGIAVGQLEIDPVSAPIEGRPRGLVGIRHANLGLDLATGTKVLFGRYRIGGAEGFGADKTYVPDNFSSMDGLSLSQRLEFGEGVKLTAGLALSNGMLNMGQTEGVYGTDGGGRFNRRGADGSLSPILTGASNRVFGEKSFKIDRAVTASLKAEVRGVTFVAYHGFETDQLVRAETAEKKEVVFEKDKPVEKVTAGTPKGVADATHTELSLGYGAIEGLSFGGWYNLMTQGKVRKVTGEEGGKLKTEADGTVSFERAVYGLGVNGDSTLFGVSNLLQTGDKLIYSASYARTEWKASGSGAGQAEAGAQSLKDAAKDAATHQFVVAGGYKVGGVTLELNLAQEVAEGKIFADDKGTPGKEDTQTNVYLASYYEF